jgi:hypothetical protein
MAAVHWPLDLAPATARLVGLNAPGKRAFGDHCRDQSKIAIGPDYPM